MTEQVPGTGGQPQLKTPGGATSPGQGGGRAGAKRGDSSWLAERLSSPVTLVQEAATADSSDDEGEQPCIFLAENEHEVRSVVAAKRDSCTCG